MSCAESAAGLHDPPLSPFQLRVFYDSALFTFNKAHSGAGLVKAGRFQLMSGVSPEMGEKKLSGDRDLKIIFTLEGNNSSSIYDGHWISAFLSNLYGGIQDGVLARPIRHLFQQAGKTFLQRIILLKPLFTCSDFRKSVATADFVWFLPDFTAEI